jgi:EAL domain-containing protein (putative c-di-GMP-specific phosphodiesterase class I)
MVALRRELERALDRDEFVFHYQPKVSFLTGRIAGAEALLRWPGADGSILPAAQFMPAVAAGGLGSALTHRMFPKLLDDLRLIRESQCRARVAFNVSAEDLADGRLVGMVRHAVSADGLDTNCLEIEVTEGTAVSASPMVSRSLTGLLAAGVSLSMDDYGVGFSSLEALNRLPFSALKMDQAFVLRMLRSPKSATLVKTSIAMAQLLGLRTVVEGIESEAVYQTLLHYGCDEGQGYWLSPPLCVEDYISLLRVDPSWPSSPVGMLRMAQLTHTWQLKLLMDLIIGHLRNPHPSAGLPEALHVGHQDCALGHWFYGAGRALAGDPDFDALEVPHRALHDHCAELLAEIEGTRACTRVHDLLLELGERSSQLSAALQRLETRLLLGELRIGCPQGRA